MPSPSSPSSSTAAPPDSKGVWSEALELVNHEESGRVVVERLLDLIREGLETPGVALYLRGEAALERELVVGSGDFPATLDGPEVSGYEVVPLPSAALLLEGSGLAAEVPGALRLTLASAVRGLVLEERLKRQRFEVNYRGVELEALYDVGLAIASTLELRELSEEILLRAVSLLDARRGALYLAVEGGYRLDRTFGGEARERVAADEPFLQRLLDGESTSEQDLVPGARHLLVVPIEGDQRPRGLLVVADKESRRGVGPFQRADRRSLGLLANQAGIALENANLHRQALEKERLEREAELAADIQRRLLPVELPAVEGLELTGWNRSARQVGGDYYDLRPLEGGRLAAVVADVTGKGMPAALLVSTVHSALRLLLDREPLGPELIARLNRHVFESSASNKFITLLIAAVDPESGEVDYLNAGHNPALLVRADGEVEELLPGGMPLGLFRDGRFEHATIRMAPGDLLCGFSDGITECVSPDDEEFGEGRLAELLREHQGRPLDEIVATIDQAVTAFADGQPQADDQTLVLVRKS